MSSGKDSFRHAEIKKAVKSKWYVIKSKTDMVSTFQNPLKLRFTQIKPRESIKIELTITERKQAGMVTKNSRSVKRNDIEITEVKE